MRWQSPAQSSWRFALFQASWFPRFPLTPPAKVTRTFDSSNPKLQEEKLYSNGGGAALEGTGWGGQSCDHSWFLAPFTLCRFYAQHPKTLGHREPKEPASATTGT